MQEEIFADAIGEIHVTNNVVRIDFVSLSPTERDANNNPKAVFKQRVVMPIDAFGNSAELIRRVMEGLIKSGAMRHRKTLTIPTDSSKETSEEQTLHMATGSRSVFEEDDRRLHSNLAKFCSGMRIAGGDCHCRVLG